MLILLFIIILLWIISIFSFARLRISLSGKKATTIRLHEDWICLAYLRISGIFILFVIFSVIKRI